MSIAESFIEYPTFSEAETTGLAAGSLKKVRKLGTNEFKGPVAAWANDRARVFGETIIPRHVYVVGLPKSRQHRVAWVYYEGFSESGEPFCHHQIACDCSGDVERAQSVEEKQTIIQECPGIQPALESHAAAINRTLGIEDILYNELKYYPKASIEEQKEIIRDFVSATLVHLLKNDYEYPRSWIANIESGWTLTTLASAIIQVRSGDIESVAQALEDEAVVELNGPVISLSPKIKESIDAERARRETLRSLEERLAS